MHIGSWGTPELGITEKVADLFGLSRNVSGGSQLKGAYTPTTLAYKTPNMSFTPSNEGGKYTYTPTTPPGGGGGGGGGGGSGSTPSAPVNDPNAPQYGWGREFPNMDAYNRFRDEQTAAIGGAWDAYINSLNEKMAGLPTQRKNLEDIVRNQYQSGVNELTGQRNLGLQDIGRAREKVVTEQKKTLNDLAEDLRNSFLAGNIYLGSRGAGDSSAANQYSYALQKMSNQNRGDVLAQSRELNADINAREARLNEITNQEMNKLASERDANILNVAQWFENAQNSVKDAQAQGRLQKGLDLASLSRDLLNQATARLQEIEDRYMNQRDALFSWATSQATNINQLKQNLAQISNIQVPSYASMGSLGATTPTIDAQGNIVASGYGYASSDEEKRRLGLI
jgi:hypothetical protein